MDYGKYGDNELVSLSRTDDAALEELLMRHKGMVKALARRYYVNGGDIEDLISEGMIGLCKAVRSFDEGSGASFTTYAYLIVNRDMINAVKKDASKKNAPLNNALPIRDAEIESGGVDPEEPVLFEDDNKRLDERLMAILSSLEYEVIKGYLDGLPYAEIAEKLNVSQKSVDNALSRAKKKIAENLGEQE